MSYLRNAELRRQLLFSFGLWLLSFGFGFILLEGQRVLLLFFQGMELLLILVWLFLAPGATGGLRIWRMIWIVSFTERDRFGWKNTEKESLRFLPMSFRSFFRGFPGSRIVCSRRKDI